MRFVIDIDYSVERMEANRRRMAARAAWDYADRVPVGFCLVPRYFTPVFKIPYQAVFASAEEQFHWQLQFLKYRLETIPEDMVCTGPVLHVAPYFDNVLDSGACGAQVVWPENETLHCLPTIGSVAQMERHLVPAPGTGLWGQACDWWHQMRELAGQTRLTFNGIEGRIEVGLLGIGGLSPHMIAIDLVGHDFYWWQMEYPAACHAFLGRITDGLIEAQRHFQTVDGRPRGGGMGLAEDTAQVMSADLFRQFCVPYARRLFAAFGPHGRGVHMCGQSGHLHQSLLDDLRITSFDLFGYLVRPEDAARALGGRVFLWGNINPMLMLEGSPAQVRQAALAALAELAPCGGFLLGDGANVCPGTPPENLAALTRASEDYGKPEVRPRPVDGSPTASMVDAA